MNQLFLHPFHFSNTTYHGKKNRQFWLFCTKFAPKMRFLFKTRQTNIIIEFSVIELAHGPNFILTTQFLLFGPNFPKKEIYSSKEKKFEYHHWIQHIQLNLSTKFQLKQMILIFWIIFAQKGYYLFKTVKTVQMDIIIIEFTIFELV